MRLTALLVAVGVTAIAAGAEDRRTSLDRDVIICIQQMTDNRVREATRIATRIFGDIGVRVEWRLSTECLVTANTIHVSFAPQTPKQEPTEVLAYAFPFEGTRIVIFPDRGMRSAFRAAST